MSSFAQPMTAPTSSVTTPTMATACWRDLGALEDEVGANDEVDAGGDHRRGVDESRHRGRALHGVEQPRLQRHLGPLAAGGEQQQQTDHGQRGLAGPARRAAETSANETVPKVVIISIAAERQSDVADPVDHERLLGRDGGGGLVLPEADEQVRRQTDALPAEEDPEVAVGQHQGQHGGDEQVEVGENRARARRAPCRRWSRGGSVTRRR